jgi:hypothetical protein
LTVITNCSRRTSGPAKAELIEVAASVITRCVDSLCSFQGPPKGAGRGFRPSVSQNSTACRRTGGRQIRPKTARHTDAVQTFRGSVDIRKPLEGHVRR